MRACTYIYMCHAHLYMHAHSNAQDRQCSACAEKRDENACTFLYMLLPIHDPKEECVRERRRERERERE